MREKRKNLHSEGDTADQNIDEWIFMNRMMVGDRV